MEFTSTTAPAPQSAGDRSKRYRNTHPDRAYASKRKYRHDKSKWQTDTQYLSRPFVVWDGEGITDPDGSHRYVMLAVKATDGDSDFLGTEKGLGTARIFDFVLATAERNPGAIHVIYGGGYDFNMWLRDYTEADLEDVYSHKFAMWHGYRVGWRAGKSFYVCRVGEDGERIGAGVTIYDVVSFFQCPFVTACDSYLGDRFEHRDMIVSNKALRSGFTDADIPEVRQYNDAELTNLLLLVSELRSRLNKVGLRPKRWDGPGAVAAALLMREHIKAAKANVPKDVAKAARHAYAGGRFEVIRYGHVDAPAYEYDVNSAYPAALREVPNLALGHWEHVEGDPGLQPFALYHLSYKANPGADMSVPGPLFRRDPNGTICYPGLVTGWYWSPEAETARAYEKLGYGTVDVLDAWVFHSTSDVKPFAFIDALYLKRKELKANGDGAQVGIKLALNSLYGKLAQQVGWERTPKGLRIPPFHQLEWAGFTTSWCRAAVLRACMDNLGSVIAFETDAVFTSAPLNVVCGENLGEFERVDFANLTYVQSGLYFGDLTDGGTVTKTRGVDRGSLTRETVLTGLGQRALTDQVAVATLTRFVGAGVALSQSWGRWRRWEIVQKRMQLGPTGKRVHYECESCKEYEYGMGESMVLSNKWHYTMCPMLDDAHSSEFPIEWINPDNTMTELSEMREGGYDFDEG